ncbi:hypothetical protein T459_08643 [Capsicum annuum]|uniref:tRNA-guanine(15) transglycosylase-like domain-containing protein n=1 Tax=Capsicum annuum TaxID=4072 RepID=A0A2G2ZX26_CAPAN|nr:hypothetical protein T459_08643 [Capsicum annuum]
MPASLFMGHFITWKGSVGVTVKLLPRDQVTGSSLGNNIWQKCKLSLEGISLKAISNTGGLHSLLGLRDHILVAVPRDSIISIPDHDSTNRIGASFETPCGRMLIKPADYMEMISSMRPNLWITLADEVPAWASEKRNKASVERTLKWLDECINSNSHAEQQRFLYRLVCGIFIVGWKSFHGKKQ